MKWILTILLFASLGGYSQTMISQSRVINLIPDLAAKEPLLTAPNTTKKYLNGYKQFVSFTTDSITAGGTSLTVPLIYGSSSSSGTLTLSSTSHATKGKIFIGSNTASLYNETLNRLGIGTGDRALTATITSADTTGAGRNLFQFTDNQVTVNIKTAATKFGMMQASTSGTGIGMLNAASSGGIFIEERTSGATLPLNSIGVLVPSSWTFVIKGAAQAVTVLNSGNVGLGSTVTSPTAILHIRAGTATASSAPLKFTAGTVLTTPESGALETNSNNEPIYSTSTTTASRGFMTVERYVAKTTTYTATSNDYTIDCTSGTFTVTLPTAVGIQGRVYIIKNSGAGTITMGGTSSQTFDGAASPTIAAGAVAQYQSNNANWIKIN